MDNFAHACNIFLFNYVVWHRQPTLSMWVLSFFFSFLSGDILDRQAYSLCFVLWIDSSCICGSQRNHSPKCTERQRYFVACSANKNNKTADLNSNYGLVMQTPSFLDILAICLDFSNRQPVWTRRLLQWLSTAQNPTNLIINCAMNPHLNPITSWLNAYVPPPYLNTEFWGHIFGGSLFFCVQKCCSKKIMVSWRLGTISSVSPLETQASPPCLAFLHRPRSIEKIVL